MEAARDGSSRKALGRGLAALIPNTPSMPATAQHSGAVRHIGIEKIIPNKRQPRKVFDEGSLAELAMSVKSQGILQPIVVRKDGDKYEIVAGERRWRAAGKAGLSEIPAIIKDYSDFEALQVALIENLQREDLDSLEEAESYQRLIKEHGFTQERIAEAVCKSRAAIANSLRLLKLSPELLDKLAEGRISAGHARALMTLEDAAQARKLAEDIVERNLSVREAERAAREMTAGAKTGRAGRRSAEELDVENRLQRALGTKVRLYQRNGKGKIEIYFHSFEELDDLLEKVSA